VKPSPRAVALREQTADVVAVHRNAAFEGVGHGVRSVDHGCQQDLRGAQTVAALYVDPKGVYANLPGVEVWDEGRDARLYAGPWPVVAHPPCARWCRLAGFVESRFGYMRGDDGGCFEAALTAVRTYGGVLEHPSDSRAFHHFGLPIPGRYGGWTSSLWDEGWSCYVEQGRYGHIVRKATWLYACGVDLPALEWGRVNDQDAYASHNWTRPAAEGRPRVGLASNRTPEAFRDALVSIARAARRG
jgi:hypothetical protein